MVWSVKLPSAWTTCLASELPARTPYTCWVVTDGKAGMESQCVGLAEALGLTPIVKRVSLRTPWRQLTPRLRLFQRHGLAAGGDRLAPPWPDLLIATGRQSVAASLIVREESRRAGRATITVQLQNPVIAARHFDLVVAPRHDRVAGENVIATSGALHRVNRLQLADGANRLASHVADLPRPYVTLLLGGSNNVYRLDERRMTVLARQLAAAARAAKGSVLVTPSRRTAPELLGILREALKNDPHFLWDGSGDNPYFGLLALADFLVVTADSVNMVSEAVATGKPVYVADLKGGSAKFRRFHRLMREKNYTRPFTGELVPYYYSPPDDLAEVVARVHKLLAARK
jgi:mitochondrial fission protein ELM1